MSFVVNEYQERESLLFIPAIRRCAWGSPRCSRSAGYGLFANFCSEHAAQLKAIREDLADEIAHRGRYAQRSDRKGYQGSTCCNVGCSNSRHPASHFCNSCLAAGYHDEEAA